MKILIITPYISPTYGGTSKVVTEVVESLASFDIEVDLVTTNADGVTHLDVPLNSWIIQKDYRVRYFPCWHRNDFIFSPSLIHWLFKHVSDYQLVHTHTIFSPLMSFAHLVCQWYRIPYVMTPHGMLDSWALAYKAWKKYFYFKIFEKPSLQAANAIQVLASSEARSVKSLGLKQSTVIPNGIHCSQFQTLPDANIFYKQFPETQGKQLILFLGRIDPKKGLDLLAPAFARVHSLFPQTHLVIAGPDSIGFLPNVEDYFQQSECLDAVTFTGMLKDKLKLAALAAASLYVAPSYSEGFSMSVLEGMASGLPCVITKGCNFPEAAKAKVAYVVDIDVEAISDALITCLSNPQQAQSMGQKARKFIFENYTWQEVAQRLSLLYTNIARTKGLPSVGVLSDVI